MAGRGADMKPAPEAPALGGLHVVMTDSRHGVEANLAEGTGPESDRIGISVNLFQTRRA